jgi:SAM-dependent methyltransferase
MNPARENAEAQRAVLRARQTASQARMTAATIAYRKALVREMFAQPVRDHVCRCIGRPVSLLRAGSLASLDELGLDQLRASGFEVTVLTVDEHGPAGTRGTDSGTAAGGKTILGDLRTVPMRPRSFDIVHCALLLHRISHVELVLDRFTAALRPGGVLLLHIRDRDCAAGFLDRIAPQWVRRALWARLNPGPPGPYRAVYEPAGSDRGIQAYTKLRGLVIAHRETARTSPAGSGRAGQAVSALRGLISRLTRGRLTDAYDEVLYVIRKPEDRLARVV